MENEGTIIIERPLTKEEKAEREAWEAGAFDREFAAVEEARLQGYQKTADPIMAQWLRGEKTEQEWLDAVQAVKDANPYPEDPSAPKKK